MKKLIVIIILILLSQSVFISKAENDPPENEKGICDSWYSEDGINWIQSTADGELKLGQPFYVKTYLKAKIDLQAMGVWLDNLGGPPYDFQLIEKPDNIPDSAQWYPSEDGYRLGDILIYNPKANDEYTFIWKCRVNQESDWIGSTSPLNLYADFKQGSTSDFKFTVADIFIKNEVWDGDIDYNIDTNSNESDSGQRTPGFELILFIASLSLLLLKFRKRK